MRRLHAWLLAGTGVLAATGFLVRPKTAAADGPNDATEKQERCATRLSGALLGRGASPELLASTDPQSAVAKMLEDPQFHERFARYLNAHFNRAPGAKPSEDAPYYLGKLVLEQKLPYKELFVGAYDVSADDKGAVAARPDPNGLGYFRSRDWLVRYAGNEGSGLKIATAYRILNNTIGLTLVATTNAPDADVSAAGRAKAPCNSCHTEQWYALDRVAKVLTKREGLGDATKFLPPTEGPQQALDGTITDDKDIVMKAVASPNFKFNACRIAFDFLYGRKENACESTIFDACVASFEKSGMIQDAIATVAKDPTFCQ